MDVGHLLLDNEFVLENFCKHQYLTEVDFSRYFQVALRRFPGPPAKSDI